MVEHDSNRPRIYILIYPYGHSEAPIQRGGGILNDTNIQDFSPPPHGVASK